MQRKRLRMTSSPKERTRCRESAVFLSIAHVYRACPFRVRPSSQLFRGQGGKPVAGSLVAISRGPERQAAANIAGAICRTHWQRDMTSQAAVSADKPCVGPARCSGCVGPAAVSAEQFAAGSCVRGRYLFQCCAIRVRGVPAP